MKGVRPVMVDFVKRAGLDLIGALLAIAYALPSLGYPFARDHPIHWYIGHRLLAGEMPYVSAVSTKPPLAFVIHAASQLVFGNHQWSIRAFDILFVLATGVLVGTLRTRRRSSDGTARDVPGRLPGEIGAGCVWVASFHYTFFDFSDTGHPELWQGFFMLATAWVIARAPGGRVSRKRAFTAGTLACCAVMLKHPAVFSGIAAGLAVVALGLAHRSPRSALQSAAWYTAGVAVVVALTVLPFWATGTLHAFWEVLVDFILNHYAAGESGLHGTPPWLTSDHGLFAVLTALALLTTGLSVSNATRNRSEYRLGQWLAVVTIVAAGTVVIQRRALVSFTFTYYFVVMTPFLASSAGWGVRRALPRSGRAQLLFALLTSAALFAYAPKGTHNSAWSYRSEWLDWVDIAQGHSSYSDHIEAYYNSRLDAYARQLQVAALINERKHPGDTICMDGFTPIFYHLTDMRCPSRMIIGDGASTPAWRAEYEAVLTNTPPTFYVTFSDRPSRIQQLERRGYERHDIDDGRRPHYVVLEHRADRDSDR